MKLIASKKYTKCCLRLYEEDFNDLEIIDLINTLKDKLSVHISCFMHSKDDAKSHYHLLITNGDFRPSALYNLGIKESWCSDVDDTKAMYFYMKFHSGKEHEDLANHHHIETILDEHGFILPTHTNEAKAREFIEWCLDVIVENGFTNFRCFAVYCNKKKPDYLPLLTRYTYYINSLLKNNDA